MALLRDSEDSRQSNEEVVYAPLEVGFAFVTTTGSRFEGEGNEDPRRLEKPLDTSANQPLSA
jgi:hypothetical protein